ncbi:hypothetical protein PR202_ga02028 [Eleusine coracana subsp. coracana]|uniref:ALOG domain-containing protein n=1 Tax=Eleusine coracana subsp. coracana TaxID=191504 RepID=A0AAV5BI54_ELECO|nr:hypothetical protein PR202_ga01341 [Eleusine coracana subsp. coracana]GJM86195.1 hypothetical protein PR202_ga02028 [Eleusine coracana subsp. coracana]
MDLSPNPESPGGGRGGGGGGGGGSGGASSSAGGGTPQMPSRYEAQKRRDWNTFGQYLRNHRPPLNLAQCSGAHVLEFLRYLDQFGKTKVHTAACPFYGHPNPPAPCPCPLRQAWGSLDALVGRLRAAFEENGGRPESNPFAARAVRLFLREVREHQARARAASATRRRSARSPHQSTPAAAEATHTTTIRHHRRRLRPARHADEDKHIVRRRHTLDLVCRTEHILCRFSINQFACACLHDFIFSAASSPISRRRSCATLIVIYWLLLSSISFINF